MQITANAKAIARHSAHDDASYQFAGLLIVSLFPALFWTALVAGVGAVIGYSPSPAALMTFGTAIAAFCAAVCQALFART
jgi:hypothetical protein